MLKRFLFAVSLCLISFNSFANTSDYIRSQIKTFIVKEDIHSMSVGINDGQRRYVIQHGKQIRYPINSLSKTFTTLALAYAANSHQLNLSDTLAKYFSTVKNKPIGNATLINLATHTTGLPLSIQQHLNTRAELIHYLQRWQPAHPIGTYRIYSNLGIGLIGQVLHQATHQSYSKLIKTIILQPLGMKQTAINPPDFHYFKSNSVFLAADGIVSNAKDMNTYLRMMMQEINLSSIMQKSVDTVLTDYYQTPYFIDDFGWNKYHWPITSKKYLRSASMQSLNTPTKRITYHKKDKQDELFLKTGAGHGYTSIMAFIPQQKRSVVILIHKNTSMRARMELAYDILQRLEKT